MRMLIVADIHYALKQFDWLLPVAGDFDAICVAGDMLDVSSSVPLTAQIVVVRSYLEKLCARTRVLVCSGNHDLTAEDADGERSAHWIPALRDLGVITDGDATTIDGTLVSVLPWWDGNKARSRIATQLQRDARDAGDDWIWVHHAPPADSITAWNGRRHLGDAKLTEWIDRYRPAAVFSGHVHPAPFINDGSWVDKVGDCWVFNMGQQPGEAPAHIIFDRDRREAAWFSIAGAETVNLAGDAQPVAGTPAWVTAADRPLAVPTA